MYAIKDLSYLQNIEVNCEAQASQHKKWGDFLYELIFKELGACLKHIWYRFYYTLNPFANHLNPTEIKKASHPGQIARILLLLHGIGGHRSCFIPLANTLKDAGFKNIYTVDLIQTSEEPVPTKPLEDKIYQLRRAYLNQGYAEVKFGLIGHSLGALVSLKYVWRRWNPSTDSEISFIVAMGGRLKYNESSFSWFCEDVRPEIERNYEAIIDAPYKTRLFSLWGENDALVPKRSAHLFGNKRRELTIKGCGHSGIVFSPEAHRKILRWVQNWFGINKTSLKK